MSQWSDNAASDDEIAVENSPGGGKSPQDEYAQVDADDAEYGRARHGL